jgi:hypothetical protein
VRERARELREREKRECVRERRGEREERRERGEERERSCEKIDSRIRPRRIGGRIPV